MYVCLHPTARTRFVFTNLPKLVEMSQELTRTEDEGIQSVEDHGYQEQKKEDEDYISLLRSTKENFSIEDDIKTFDRITTTRKEIKEYREAKIEEKHKVIQSQYRRHTCNASI